MDEVRASPCRRVSRACQAWAAALLAAALALPAWAVDTASAKAGIQDCTPALTGRHNPGLLAPAADTELVCFSAYLSGFNTRYTQPSGKLVHPGLPHWVVQNVRKTATAPEKRGRPNAWFSSPPMVKQGIAPTDDSYVFSKPFREANSNWYERGHLAQKYLAEREPDPKAGWFTHNLVNAVPQLSRFNKGPWLMLECYSGAWANQAGDIWVVSGPIFLLGRPARWLTSDNRPKALPVAIPDALFKVVLRKHATQGWEGMAFILPQEDPSYLKGPWNLEDWLTSIAQIEKLTGQTFFPAGGQDTLKPQVAEHIWPIKKTDFDPGCKAFAKDVP